MVEDAPTPPTPDAPKEGSAGSQSAKPPSPPPRGAMAGRFGLLVPALALVVGLVLGGTVVALTRTDSGNGAGGAAGAGTGQTTDATAGTGTPGQTTSATPLVVNVPAECVQLGDEARQVLDLLDKAVIAARDLNATELSALVPQMQEAEQTLRAQSEACRTASTSG